MQLISKVTYLESKEEFIIYPGFLTPVPVFQFLTMYELCPLPLEYYHIYPCQTTQIAASHTSLGLLQELQIKYQNPYLLAVLSFSSKYESLQPSAIFYRQTISIYRCREASKKFVKSEIYEVVHIIGCHIDQVTLNFAPIYISN